MNTITLHRSSLALAAVLTVLLAAAAGYGISAWRHGAGSEASAEGAMAAASSTGAASVASANTPSERKALYWYDPMKPEAHFDKPGKSPFMDMQLVAKYAEEGGAAGGANTGVSVNPRVAQNLGLRVATVAQETLASSVDAVGTLGFNERDVAIVQTRSAGFVERTTPRAPGDVIAAGSLLAELLVPEWAGAQQEYLAVRATGDAPLAAAARQRLLLLGMGEALVREVERSGKAQPLMAVTSPIGGVIQELMVRPGMSLAAGMTLARINGLASWWLEVAVPEVHAALLQPGRPVKVNFAAYPGESFEGRIAVVLPEASRDTRTLRVRIELPNRGGRLKAGMFASASIKGPAQQALVVPSEAVIRTGTRALVYVVGDKPGQYDAVPVELGREVGGKLVVLKGLSAGQQVVVSGQFLIDSEASLSGVVNRGEAAMNMGNEAAMAPPNPAKGAGK